MTYKEARVYLDDLSKYGSVLGLDTIRGLLRELGDPQDDLRFIHIAGTNGKGSVLAYTSTILSEAGYRIGRYVSPTVISYLERIQVDGTWISETKFAEMTALVTDAVARLEDAGKPVPTVFEAETAIAFLYFREMKCDLVVLEAGLGGALDATNIIKNTVCAVLTPVSLDHVGVIGSTLEEIAENKAGIIKPGCAVISAGQSPSVTKILKRSAARCHCPFIQAEPDQTVLLHSGLRGLVLSYKEFDQIHTSLAGSYQADNLVTALETVRALRQLGWTIRTEDIRRGAERTAWPGRFTCIGAAPAFLLDGAHNEAAALGLRETLETYFPGRKLIFILGVFRDKDYRAIARIMCPLASSVYTVDLPDQKRGLPADALAQAVKPYCPHTAACTQIGTDRQETDPIDRQKDGIRRAVISALEEAGPEDVIAAFGSLSYLHQVKEAYDQARDHAGSKIKTDRDHPVCIEKEGGTFDDRQ